MNVMKVELLTWHNQDALGISIEEWISLLHDTNIFDSNGVDMLNYVYSQPKCQSSATEIGLALGGVSQQQITAWNRNISRKIYKNFDKEPPFNCTGGKRFWNVVFDGNSEDENNDLGYFIWKIRPNLIFALERLGVAE